MAGHRPDRRRLKMHRTYTVDEAARTLDVAKGTVRRWVKDGLSVIDSRRPALILGSELRDHLKRKATPKQPCPPGQCYCVKCKKPAAPDGGMAEYVWLTPTSGNLRGLCPTCGTMMHRRTSAAQLERIRSEVDVTMVEGSRRLRDSDEPSTDDH